MSNITIKKKLAPKDFAPKRVLAGKETSLWLGRVIGIASGTVTSEAKDGQILEGLKGQFRFIDNETGEQLSAYILWLPSDMGIDIFDAAREGMAQFAIEIGVEKQENPAGYGWMMRNLIEGVASPLDTLIESIKPKEAIAAPETAKTAPELGKTSPIKPAKA